MACIHQHTNAAYSSLQKCFKYEMEWPNVVCVGKVYTHVFFNYRFLVRSLFLLGLPLVCSSQDTGPTMTLEKWYASYSVYNVMETPFVPVDTNCLHVIHAGI